MRWYLQQLERSLRELEPELDGLVRGDRRARRGDRDGGRPRVERGPGFVVRFLGGIHPSARKHGIADEDLEHAINNAMTVDDQEADVRLYLGPARNADLLEIGTIIRSDGTELAIHAMPLRPTYHRLLPSE